MSTESLHFRVGADAGILLMNIAQEHLLYGLDIDKALTVFSDSFGGGCPEEMQLKLLKGDLVIEVDEESQQFLVGEREEHHNAIFPAVIDFNQLISKKQKDLDGYCKDLDKALDIIIGTFRYKSSFKLNFSIQSVMNYIYGKDEEFKSEVMDAFEYDEELQQMRNLIRITKDFIEKSLKFSTMVRRLAEMYKVEEDFNTYDLLNLAQKIQDIARCNFVKFTEGDDNTLTNYLEASREIDAVISKGIEPVDIMDNYSAGWLSPEGEYYALNGEIANMLHNQIASALQEKGLIPENDEKGMELNPDAWLEQQGWVKIHENKVQFAGNLNHKIGKTNVRMTDKQIEIIKDYISNCHQCIIKAGWRLEKQSIGMFTAMAMSDHLALNKKYFDFD